MTDPAAQGVQTAARLSSEEQARAVGANGGGWHFKAVSFGPDAFNYLSQNFPHLNLGAFAQKLNYQNWKAACTIVPQSNNPLSRMLRDLIAACRKGGTNLGDAWGDVSAASYTLGAHVTDVQEHVSNDMVQVGSAWHTADQATLEDVRER